MLWQNKLELAAGDFLNTNIVCREMGLRDKQEHEHTGKIEHQHKISEPLQEALDAVYKPPTGE
jgi:hypothetical protein